METTEKLSDKVTMSIMEMITISKRFKPGDKLPNENELSDELGVSRTTLREAVNNLVNQNVLVKRRGYGTFVVDNEELTEDFGFDELIFSQVSLADLYELRLVIEPQVAGLAAEKATDQEMKNICRIAGEMEKKTMNAKEMMEYNRKFHDSIAAATHNEFIVRLFHSINHAVIKEFDSSYKEPVNNEDMINSHKMLIEYLKLRDKEAASYAMRLHLKYTMKQFHLISDGL